ncbi:CRAL-TRIO domain-containing protein [Trichonephila clavata]|uniref:CRAL-TRIO domain-containing protein n=1 Tax=Trichonephila clavata TaxID=2740835 RepID=A0A8X6ICH5_TRICU|nr:CRAL-TRIO domain-containing protein [Trichonephila clavata]
MNTQLRSFEFSDYLLDDELLKSIRKQQNETLKTRIECLKSFRERLSGNIDFKPCLDENFLLRFLRGAKYNLEIAFHRIRKYYHTRNLYPDIFENYLPSATALAQSLIRFTALPFRANDLTPVVIFRLGLIDFQCISFEELLRLIFLITEALLLNELTQLTGITAIVDFNEWSYQQIRYIFPSRLPICYNVFHSACTLRIKYLHLVNTPGLLYYLQEYLISSFSQKIKDRIKCYPVNSSLETLYRHVPPEILPEEYGGSLPSSSMVDLNSIINEQKSYFQRQLQYGLLDEKMN